MNETFMVGTQINYKTTRMCATALRNLWVKMQDRSNSPKKKIQIINDPSF